jgi:hypothetical protein
VKYNGANVDWCRDWATNCGTLGAENFCRLQHYARAQSFSQGHMSPTLVLTQDPSKARTCTGSSCVGFTSVQCAQPLPGASAAH